MKWSQWTVVLSLIFFITSCKTGGNVTRTLTSVDLSSEENRSYLNFPNEFNLIVLSSVLAGNTDAYTIDYASFDAPRQTSVDSLYELLSDTFYEDEIDGETASSYLSLASLVTVDAIEVDGAFQHANFITFYFPGSVTPDGFDKPFCSVAYDEALDALESIKPTVIWYRYARRDWGWITQEVFQPTYLSSNVLGQAWVSACLQDSAAFSPLVKIQKLRALQQQPESIFATTISQHQGSVYFETPAESILLGTYDASTLRNMDDNETDSTWILPMAAAFENRLYTSQGQEVISENGVTGNGQPDPLSAKPGNKTKSKKPHFKPDQKFVYHTVERITRPEQPTIVKDLVEALRRGEIGVYEGDNFETKVPSGHFFDGLLVENEDGSNVMIEHEDLAVSLVTKSVTFDLTGNVSTRVTGVGVVAPGHLVPEGFDRTLGYFTIDDLERIATLPAHFTSLPLLTSTIQTTK